MPLTNLPRGSGVLAHALSKPGLLAGSGRWGDLWLRFASAAVLGPIALLCLWFGSYAWDLFILIAVAGLALEWRDLAGLTPRRVPALLLNYALLIAVVFAALGDIYLSFAVLGVGAVALAAIKRFFAASGVPYAGLGAVCLIWLRGQPGFGLDDTLFLVFVIWGTDIGAYAIGRLIGGAKMAPRISPGKTWAGAIGGLLTGALVGGLLAGQGHQVLLAALPAGLVLSVAAQAGDLLESAIKRQKGVKDSGLTIPGHGGLFDRLDGFLAAAPVAAIFVLFTHGAAPLWG